MKDSKITKSINVNGKIASAELFEMALCMSRGFKHCRHLSNSAHFSHICWNTF